MQNSVPIRSFFRLFFSHRMWCDDMNLICSKAKLIFDYLCSAEKFRIPAFKFVHLKHLKMLNSLHANEIKCVHLVQSNISEALRRGNCFSTHSISLIRYLF